MWFTRTWKGARVQAQLQQALLPQVSQGAPPHEATPRVPPPLTSKSLALER